MAAQHKRLTIIDLKYREAKRTGLLQQDRRFYIKLTVDDQVRKTSVSAKTNTPSWDNTFYLYAPFAVLFIL